MDPPHGWFWLRAMETPNPRATECVCSIEIRTANNKTACPQFLFVFSEVVLRRHPILGLDDGEPERNPHGA